MEEEQKQEQNIKVNGAPEPKIEANKAINSEEGNTSSMDGKVIVVMLLVVVGIFFLAIAGFKTYNYFTSAEVINIDDLHQENLQGNLDETEGYMYNGFSWIYADGLWWTELDRFGTLLKIPLHFGPKDVENISVIGTLSPDFNKGQIVYVAVDPNITNKYYTLGLSELNFNIIKGIDRNIVTSCTENSSICDNRTIVSCETAKGRPIIQLVVANVTQVEFKNTCIKISGDGYDLVKAVDRVLMKWYGIIN
ncbi:MAG: hypothetical protein WCV90_03375 [Candidatus Woesearchaeota archaeon]|jgi:hypothetical protein